MQRIHVVVVALWNGLGALVPLLAEFLEIVVNVLFELSNGFGRESVSDGLAFTCVFTAVARVEETAADGDKGVVVFAAK